ncbi:MAG TPA: AAA family ATPase [Thermoplasmata archaeon]|nr:AAA family ATPase [Thermoplasmata archaeon]
MARILLNEETLDPGYLPGKMVRREKELQLLTQRYREALSKGVPAHQLITGGVGSGKTTLAQRLGEDLQKGGRLGALNVQKLYVNCWRRSNDRTILLQLLRGVGVSLPDRGYSLSEMLDVFEQGIRKSPRHLLVLLDESSALVRQETKLVYLLTRSPEVELGSISLVLIASEDVLPFLDAASRSSFGVTHRLQLRPYDVEDLTAILEFRAGLALAPGSFSKGVLEQIAQIAASNGDARFALELLTGAARAAESEGARAIAPEHVRAAKGSLYPTISETKIEELPTHSLLVLLAVARSLRGPKTSTTTEIARQAYGRAAEERGQRPMSRVTFWRTAKELEREGLLIVESGGAGQSARLRIDEVPTSFLETVLGERLGGRRTGKA